MDDADEILRRCQNGGEDDCAVMARAFQVRIYRLALRMTGSEERAETATLAALYKIWTTARQWKGQCSAVTWIDRIAVRTVLDQIRADRRWWKRWQSIWPKQPADRHPTAEQEITKSEDRKQLAKRIDLALAELAPDDRALIHLYYFEERSNVELSAIFNISRDSVKMRLSRVRQKLKTILESDDANEPDR